jgi:hypothetical protein
MKAHQDVYRHGPFKLIPLEFRIREVTELDGVKKTERFPTCSYCGSLSIEAVLQAFQTAGMEWSGSDWKYGWPHKFYLEIPCEPMMACVSRGPDPDQFGYARRTKEHFKFYSEHLIDATPEQLEEWNRVVMPITKIRFVIGSDGELRYSSPCHGYQGHGTIAAAA